MNKIVQHFSGGVHTLEEIWGSSNILGPEVTTSTEYMVWILKVFASQNMESPLRLAILCISRSGQRNSNIIGCHSVISRVDYKFKAPKKLMVLTIT